MNLGDELISAISPASSRRDDRRRRLGSIDREIAERGAGCRSLRSGCGFGGCFERGLVTLRGSNRFRQVSSVIMISSVRLGQVSSHVSSATMIPSARLGQVGPCMSHRRGLADSRPRRLKSSRVRVRSKFRVSHRRGLADSRPRPRRLFAHRFVG